MFLPYMFLSNMFFQYVLCQFMIGSDYSEHRNKPQTENMFDFIQLHSSQHRSTPQPPEM